LQGYIQLAKYLSCGLQKLLHSFCSGSDTYFQILLVSLASSISTCMQSIDLCSLGTSCGAKKCPFSWCVVEEEHVKNKLHISVMAYGIWNLGKAFSWTYLSEWNSFLRQTLREFAM